MFVRLHLYSCAEKTISGTQRSASAADVGAVSLKGFTGCTGFNSHLFTAVRFSELVFMGIGSLPVGKFPFTWLGNQRAKLT